MNDHWTDFLARQGARNDLWGTHSFAGYPEGPSNDDQSTWLCDLGYQGLLSLQGPDAVKFLQGQVTCDVRELADHQSLLGAQCDLKGRVLASFRALQTSEQEILLRLHRGLIDATHAALSKYMVFSKASLTDISNEWRHLGLYGPDATSKLQSLINAPLPVQQGTWLDAGDIRVLRLDEQRLEIWVSNERAESLWQQLAPDCQLGGSNAWMLWDIRAGLAEIQPQTRELFTPQALNYQWVQAISFRKGCYTGQEIVARLHYKATLKNRLYRFFIPANNAAELPVPGQPWQHLGETLGTLVMRAQTAEGATEALLVSSINTAEQAHWQTVDPEKIHCLPLPYAIPKQDD